MTDKTYPLHHTDAQPLYRQVTEDDYRRLKAENEELKEKTRWRKVSEELPDVSHGESDVFLVVVDYYNTYFLNSPRGRYVTEATYSVSEDEESCFYRANSDQEINETFEGRNGEDCYEKVIMWMPLPEPPK